MTNAQNERERLYSVKDYAKAWGVHEQTVRRWIRDGILETVRPTPKGCIRIRVRIDLLRQPAKT